MYLKGLVRSQTKTKTVHKELVQQGSTICIIKAIQDAVQGGAFAVSETCSRANDWTC